LADDGVIEDPNLDWLEAELAEAFDEDQELELSESALSLEIRRIYNKARPPSIASKDYFRLLQMLLGARIADSAGPAGSRPVLTVPVSR